MPAATFHDAAPVGAKVLIYARRQPSPAPVLQFTRPQGFLIEIDGRVVHPLEWSGHGQPLFKKGDPDPSRLGKWAPPRAAG